MLGFVRVASAVPRLQVGDVSANTEAILENISTAKEGGANIILFPELSLCGYTAGDLLFQEKLQRACAVALSKIAKSTLSENFCVVVGAPLVIDGELYNCAVTVSNGKIAGITPKSFLPNHSQYYEKRWFSPASALTANSVSARSIGTDCESDYDIPVGASLVFRSRDNVKFSAEICEDLYAPIPPSTAAALSGAEIILNLSASDEAVGKREFRKKSVLDQSARCLCAYALCSSGEDESTTDGVFSGHSVIAENGSLTAENEKYVDRNYILYADVDTEAIRNERIKNNTFYDCRNVPGRNAKCEIIPVDSSLSSDGKLRKVSPRPFVPADPATAEEHCKAVFELQVTALKRRLKSVGAVPVIGVSGGLDSTLALLVCVEAVRRNGGAPVDVHALTMPCFGTTDRTRSNAWKLMEALGVTALEISIKDACTQHCRDIGHPIDKYNVTFENIQARERTQVLMDYSCRVGGLVIGTGDLSELALGWCTYNADHMSMYGVNCSVPKTLLKYMIETMAKLPEYECARKVLLDIVDTPISPELLPPDADGNIGQETESLVGPYILHDFFLYYTVRYGFSPEKVYFLAKEAFATLYSDETVKKWLKVFYRRFFTQQFKRNCQPDGVKVGSVALSPRGDWKMPSDASAALWLSEAESL